MAFAFKAGSSDETYWIDEFHKWRVDHLLRQRGNAAEQIELLLELIEARAADAPAVELTDGRRECAVCGSLFSAKRSDKQYCSGCCRMRALRPR